MAAQKRGLLMRTVAIFIAINPSETERQAEKWNNLPTSREPIPPCNLNAFCFSDPATPFPHHQGFSHVIPSGGNSTALGSRATFTLLYRNNHVTRMSCSTTTPFPPPQSTYIWVQWFTAAESAGIFFFKPPRWMNKACCSEPYTTKSQWTQHRHTSQS